MTTQTMTTAAGRHLTTNAWSANRVDVWIGTQVYVLERIAGEWRVIARRWL